MHTDPPERIGSIPLCFETFESVQNSVTDHRPSSRYNGVVSRHSCTADSPSEGCLMAEQRNADTSIETDVNRSLTVTISNTVGETIDKYTIVIPEGLSWRIAKMFLLEQVVFEFKSRVGPTLKAIGITK